MTETKSTANQSKVFYWSRRPGNFVNKFTGKPAFQKLMNESSTPVFWGTIREWYETLVESIIDAGNMLHKRNLQAPKSIEVSRDVLTMLECTIGFRPTYYVNGTVPELKSGDTVGSLNNRYTVVLNDDLPHNEVRVRLVSDMVHTFKGMDADNVPHVELQRLPEAQELDSMTVHVLDMPSCDEIKNEYSSLE